MILSHLIVFSCVVLIYALTTLSTTQVQFNSQTFEIQPTGSVNDVSFLLLRLPQEQHNESNSSSENEITSGKNGISYLESFSLCLWFSVNFFSRDASSTVLSYASPSDPEALTLSVRPSGLYVFARQYWARGFIHEDIYPRTWYHICIVVGGTQDVRVHLNGRVSYLSEISIKLTVPGSMVIGQDQDVREGGYSLPQAFRGKVSHVSLWNRALDESQVNHLASCNHGGSITTAVEAVEEVEEKGAVQNLKNVSFQEPLRPMEVWWQVNGNIVEHQTGPCNRPNWPMVIFTKRLNFMEAQDYLTQFNMVLTAPSNAREETLLKSVLEKLSSYCASIYSTRSATITSVVYSDDTNEWVDISTNKTRNEIELEGKANRIAYFTSSSWYSGHSRSKHCFIGVLKTKAVQFFVRGLHLGDDLGNKHDEDPLIIVPSDDNNRPVFAGKYNLILYKHDETWTLKEGKYNKILVTITTDTIPIGRREWSVKNSRLMVLLDYSRSLNLTLSKCLNDEYTCTDGSCISLDQRCDLSRNCLDWGDETNCKLLQVPHGYVSNLPPTIPLNVTLHIRIIHIKVYLIKMEIEMDVLHDLRWYDQRLQYFNLRDEMGSNIVSSTDGEVWRPETVFTPCSSVAERREPLLMVKRMEENPEPDDKAENYRYDGKDNLLVLRSFKTLSLRCTFHLNLFPWDQQICHMQVFIENIQSDGMIFTDASWAMYMGPTTLEEYIVQNFSMIGEVSEERKNPTNVSGLSHKKNMIITIQLSRRYWQHIMVNYVPTTLLLAIGYGTLFIPVESFSDRGTISLTTLLVLVSLYSENVLALPRTAYSKHIDVWFLFTIIYLSCIIFVHLASSRTVGLNYNTHLVIVRGHSQVSPNNAQSSKRETKFSLLSTAQVTFALVFLFFIVIYIAIICRSFM